MLRAVLSAVAWSLLAGAAVAASRTTLGGVAATARAGSPAPCGKPLLWDAASGRLVE
jgi:hypothetical protein